MRKINVEFERISENLNYHLTVPELVKQPAKCFNDGYYGTVNGQRILRWWIENGAHGNRAYTNKLTRLLKSLGLRG